MAAIERTAVVALLIASASCRGCREQSAPPAPPQPGSAAAPPAGAPAHAPVDAPAEAEEPSILPPHIALSVHGAAKVELGPGWGWVIDASALDRDAFVPDAGPKRSPGVDGGAASAAFSLQLSRADGTPVPLKAASVAVPPSAQEIAEGGTIAEARWLVGPQDTQLPPGKYELVAVLEAPAAGAGWSGRTVSGPVRVTIAAPPSPLTPAWMEQERLVRARYAEAASDLASARAEIEALLKAQPENISALTAKGDLQATADDKAGALQTFELALSLLEKRDQPPPEPPTYLLHRQRDLALALRKK